MCMKEGVMGVEGSRGVGEHAREQTTHALGGIQARRSGFLCPPTPPHPPRHSPFRGDWRFMLDVPVAGSVVLSFVTFITRNERRHNVTQHTVNGTCINSRAGVHLEEVCVLLLLRNACAVLCTHFPPCL